MKNIVMVVACAILGSLALLIVMTINGRSNRSMEIRSGLSAAVEETVVNLAEKDYSIADQDQYVADFISTLSEILDANSFIQIEILGASKEKGMLSLLVTEEFVHPNGNRGSVACERTVILNRLDEPEPGIYTVQFYIQPEGVYDRSCYRTCRVREGDCVTAPSPPLMEDAAFSGWVDAGGYLADFSEPVMQDMEYYAVWN